MTLLGYQNLLRVNPNTTPVATNTISYCFSYWNTLNFPNKAIFCICLVIFTQMLYRHIVAANARLSLLRFAMFMFILVIPSPTRYVVFLV